MNTVSKIGPVVNGLVLEVSDRGRSGFFGVYQRFQGADAMYGAAIGDETVIKHGGNPTQWPRSQGGGLNLGYYKDPRIPAYLLAYYTQNPDELIRVFNREVQPGPGKLSTKRQVEEGALAVNLPAELFQVPTDYADLMRAFPASERGNKRGTVTVTVATGMNQWSQLLKDYGISGAQVWAALGGTPADQTFVLGLRTADYETAKAALSSRGLDLDLDGAQRIQAA